MPAKPRPPTARLRRLASELLGLRRTAGLSREVVAEQTGINPATLYRVETAKARPQARTLKALLDLYRVTEDKRSALRELLHEADRQTWSRTLHEELPAQYNTYIEFESEAQALWMYGASIVPGLLQTEDYARAVIAGMLPQATGDEIEARVEARMRRQAVLTKDRPLKLWVVLDEAALRRPAGNDAVMAAQIAYLRAMLDRPHVTLQVLPFDAGPHPAMLGAFVVLKFDEPVTLDIVYLESLAGDLLLDDEPRTHRYVLAFEHLRARASSPTATDSVLAAMAGVDVRERRTR